MSNTKMIGSNLIECIPQGGKCPIDCKECYYNRPDGTYARNEWAPIIPTIEEAKGKIVRMNTGHDSNIDVALVLETAGKYEHVFMNTSIPMMPLNYPYVLTVNRSHKAPWMPDDIATYEINKLMFVRVCTSPYDMAAVFRAVFAWERAGIPVVLTFMAYYTQGCTARSDVNFEHRKRHDNEYWCLTKEAKLRITNNIGLSRLVTMCGTFSSDFCKDCHNCETYYWQTYKRMFDKL